jgi:hypothetical protein
VLTEEELALIKKLGACANDFMECDAFHPSDVPEFFMHVHALQNLVMSNSARRDHPEAFPRHLVGTNGNPQPNPASRIERATSLPGDLLRKN